MIKNLGQTSSEEKKSRLCRMGVVLRNPASPEEAERCGLDEAGSHRRRQEGVCGGGGEEKLDPMQGSARIPM